jgi:hypothetical protein
VGKWRQSQRQFFLDKTATAENMKMVGCKEFIKPVVRLKGYFSYAQLRASGHEAQRQQESASSF